MNKDQWKTRFKIVKNSLIQLKHTFGKQKTTYPVPIAIIRQTLNEMGIDKGASVLVHSSVSDLFFGYDKPSEERYQNKLQYSFDLIEMLIDLVGQEGTILMPTDPKGYPDIRSTNNEIFNFKKDPSSRGLITEIFRRRPDTIRSIHPHYNLTAWGAEANEFLKDNEKSHPYVMDKNSPWYKLIEKDGFVLILGKDYQVNSSVHIVEDILGKEKYPRDIFEKKSFSLKYIDKENNLKEMELYLHLSHWVDESVIEFCEYLNQKYQFGKKLMIGKVPIIIFNAKKYYNAVLESLEKDDVCFSDFKIHYID